jgi:hypothetical protein
MSQGDLKVVSIALQEMGRLRRRGEKGIAGDTPDPGKGLRPLHADFLIALAMSKKIVRISKSMD